MIFSVLKKLGFWVFLVHPTVVSVLLSASVERCFVSRMRDFYQLFSKKNVVPPSQIYVIIGRHRALYMSKDTHLL